LTQNLISLLKVYNDDYLPERKKFLAMHFDHQILVVVDSEIEMVSFVRRGDGEKIFVISY